MNQQIALHNKISQSQGCDLFHLVESCLDSLNWWAEQKNARPLALASNKIKGNREKF